MKVVSTAEYLKNGSLRKVRQWLGFMRVREESKWSDAFSLTMECVKLMSLLAVVPAIIAFRCMTVAMYANWTTDRSYDASGMQTPVSMHWIQIVANKSSNIDHRFNSLCDDMIRSLGKINAEKSITIWHVARSIRHPNLSSDKNFRMQIHACLYALMLIPCSQRLTFTQFSCKRKLLRAFFYSSEKTKSSPFCCCYSTTHSKTINWRDTNIL